MPTVFQVDYPFTGPWGAEMFDAMQSLAQDIAQEPGLIWKIWTENPTTGRAGGIYLFETPGASEAFATKHLARLESLGIIGVVGHHFAINDDLSQITNFAATTD